MRLNRVFPRVVTGAVRGQVRTYARVVADLGGMEWFVQASEPARTAAPLIHEQFALVEFAAVAESETVEWWIQASEPVRTPPPKPHEQYSLALPVPISGVPDEWYVQATEPSWREPPKAVSYGEQA